MPMSLDHVNREPVLNVNSTEAVKLLTHEGAAIIALTINTDEGTRRFFLQGDTAPELVNHIQQALDSPGLKPIV